MDKTRYFIGLDNIYLGQKLYATRQQAQALVEEGQKELDGYAQRHGLPRLIVGVYEMSLAGQQEAL